VFGCGRRLRYAAALQLAGAVSFSASLGCPVDGRHSSNIEKLLVVPNVLVPRRQLHTPAWRQPEKRHDFGTALRDVLNVERLEERGIFGKRVTPPNVPTTGTVLCRVAKGIQWKLALGLERNTKLAPAGCRLIVRPEALTDLALLLLYRGHIRLRSVQHPDQQRRRCSPNGEHAAGASMPPLPARPPRGAVSS